MSHVQEENKKSSMIMQILKGLIFALIITLISLFIFSMVLTYSNLSESIIPIVIIVLTMVSIFIGSLICVRKINKNGMLSGAILGGIYVLLLYLISSLLNTGFTINIYTIIMIVTGILAGMVGGIIGVNI